jgi:hypothetical protein
MTAWLGVVSADHVARAVDLGVAQIGHGQKTGLARMGPGDLLVYYSARQTIGGDPLRAFTAIGRVVDDALWQADEGEFHPWRRKVHYATVTGIVPLADVQGDLDLCQVRHWGYQLRRGLVELSVHDARVLSEAFGSTR